ncbi:MAG: hypothetical protein V5A24_04650 [Haloarculaceae archaeon]
MPDVGGGSLDDGQIEGADSQFEETDSQFEEVSGTEFDRLVGILADGVVGAAGGLVGTAAMIVVLLVGESVGVFPRPPLPV